MEGNMQIRIATEQEREQIYALRMEVFVREQQVPPEIELDEEDSHALHILAESDGVCVGCARLLLTEQDAHIGRLAVKKEYRFRGIGSKICRFIIDNCRARGDIHIWLNAQCHAVQFYEKLGFRVQGEPFWEAGIEHLKMEWCKEV